MSTPFMIAERAVIQLRQREEFLVNSLLGGGMKSFDEYRYWVGKLEGIREAIAIQQELVDAAKDE